MKIRTDFVTNSSSSSFICATIDTTDQELLQFAQDVENLNILSICAKSGYIEINDMETAYDFDNNNIDLRTPEGVICALMNSLQDSIEYSNIDKTAAEQKLQKLKERKEELAKSISGYEITVGREGNSAEDDCLCEDYVKSVIKDDDEYEEAWNALIESDEWCSKREIYFYSGKSKKCATVETEFSGPLDGGW